MTEITDATLRNILGKHVPTIDWTKVSLEVSLEGVGVDSLDKANIFLEIEELSGVRVNDEEYEKLDSIGAILEKVSNAS